MDRMTHNKASRPPIIALYQPDIPQNTASIIRTCSCFGLKVEIIEPCGFSLEDKRFKRVVMDYYNKKMIKNYMSWSSFINFKTKRNQRVLLFFSTGPVCCKIWIVGRFQIQVVFLKNRDGVLP